MVAAFVDFGVRWESFWLLVDVCLLGAELGAELNVVDVARLIEECEEAFTLHGVVLVAYTFCNDKSQCWAVSVDRSLPGSSLSDYCNRFDTV